MYMIPLVKISSRTIVKYEIAMAKVVCAYRVNKLFLACLSRLHYLLLGFPLVSIWLSMHHTWIASFSSFFLILMILALSETLPLKLCTGGPD